MDRTDFENTMQTLGWSAGDARGFEQVAYGSRLSLIHYREMTAAARLAWAKANNALSDQGQVGIRKTKQGTYLAWLNQLRLGTYGPALDDASVVRAVSAGVQAPWALSDFEFMYCMNWIRTGQAPDEGMFRERFGREPHSATRQFFEAVFNKETSDYIDKAGAFVIGRSIATAWKLKSFSGPIGVGASIGEW